MVAMVPPATPCDGPAYRAERAAYRQQTAELRLLTAEHHGHGMSSDDAASPAAAALRARTASPYGRDAPGTARDQRARRLRKSVQPLPVFDMREQMRDQLIYSMPGQAYVYYEMQP